MLKRVAGGYKGYRGLPGRSFQGVTGGYKLEALTEGCKRLGVTRC